MPALPVPPHFPERRRPVVSAVSTSRFYIVTAILLALVTVGAVLTIVLLQPQNTRAIEVIKGIMEPIIIALLGGGGLGALKVLDGHQSQLMGAIAAKERAEGVIEGLKENPNTNIS